jgi:hypothetical protein
MGAAMVRRGLVWGTGAALFASAAQAHGFGQRYDLPIPLSFYVFGAGATVLLSFVLAAMFLRTVEMPHLLAGVPLLRTPRSRRILAICAGVARMLAAAYFVVMIAAGLFGVQAPMRNIIVASVWIVGWVAISLVCALIGNVWRLLNPWDTLFTAAEAIHGRLQPRRSLSLQYPYPAVLDRWPAFFLFVMFAWMELVWSGRDVPAQLAMAILLYSAWSWLGMLAFGRETWLARADMFSAVFGIFSRFAPLTSAPDHNGGLRLRIPGSGLISDQVPSSATMLLVVALLATVTFDGLLETPLWARIDVAIIDTPDESFLWSVLHLSEAAALRWAHSLGFVLFVGFFAAAYILFCKLMAWASGTKEETLALARRFVFTLLPISIAYHIAHYFSYLVNGSQLVIPLLSDPFGFGWDLFRTAAYKPDIGFVGPLLQWYVAVGAIVVGHVIAVYLAHVKALTVFGAPRVAVRSQIPIVVFMVGYTMLSLWILSQPIVETSPAA